MTEHELEQRLRAWYRSEADAAADGAPASLRSSVGAISYAEPMPRPWLGWNPFRTRRSLALAAALALLTVALAAGAVAVGSGLIRLPWETERPVVEPSAIDPCVLMRLYASSGPGVVLAGGHGPIREWGVDRGCATGWDSDLSANHLYLRDLPLSTAAAAALVRDLPYTSSGAPRHAVLATTAAQEPPIRAWTAVLADPNATPGGRTEFGVTIVSYEPYFFIVTGDGWAQVSAAATAVEQLDRLNAVARSLGLDPCSLDLAAAGFTSSPTVYGVTPELKTCRFAEANRLYGRDIFVSVGPVASPGNLNLVAGYRFQNHPDWQSVSVAGHPAQFTSCAPPLTDPGGYGAPGPQDYGDRCPALIHFVTDGDLVLVTLYPGADASLAITIAEQVLAGQ